MIKTNENHSARGLKAKSFFESGYNCAQSVVLAFTEEMGMDAETASKLASPFGAGMGRLREVCGAFSGSLLVIGNLFGVSDPLDAEGKGALYKDIQDLASKFRAANGSLICRELLHLSEKSSAPTPEARTQEYYRNRPCGEIVAKVTDLLEDYVATRQQSAPSNK